jgi:phosphoglycolate phosphatase
MRRMKRPLAILLDLDGTLVDCSEPIVDGILEVAALEGLTVPDRDWARARIGFPGAETWGLLGAKDPAAMLLRYREHVNPTLAERTRVLPGANEALAELSARGHRLAVATTRGNVSAREGLAATGLLTHLSVVVGADDVQRHKPHPDPLLLALERLSVKADTALMVGDTDADIGAAHAAGMPCWSVLGGTHDEKTLREAGADLILAGGIAELPAALDRLSPAEPASS